MSFVHTKFGAKVNFEKASLADADFSNAKIVRAKEATHTNYFSLADLSNASFVRGESMMEGCRAHYHRAGTATLGF